MFQVGIEEEFLVKVPQIQLGCIQCLVKVKESPKELLEEVQKEIELLKEKYSLDSLKDRTNIRFARASYRNCGKDPSRYRLSAEALSRRIFKDQGIASINNVVDILNMISFRTGLSIGGFDADAIMGNEIFLGVGREKEPYAAIGRGKMNIEQIPILRDAGGAFGNPTSDSERTSVTEATTSFMMVFYAFGRAEDLEDILLETTDYLEQWADAEEFERWIIEA